MAEGPARDGAIYVRIDAKRRGPGPEPVRKALWSRANSSAGPSRRKGG